MRHIKNHIFIVCLAVFMLLAMSGCAKHGECESCGQNEKLNKYVEDDGDVRWYCDDCYRMAKLFDS